MVRFLIVAVGGTHLALHADRVQGLLTLGEAAVSGDTLTVQGLTYNVIDLAARLRLQGGPDSSDTRLVLLARGTQRGFVRVDEVRGLRELEPAQVLPLSRHFQGDEQRWYQGLILFDEGVALILNPAWLMERNQDADAVGTVGARQALALQSVSQGHR
jgi:chemotaxis protein histidine kinase CheA